MGDPTVKRGRGKPPVKAGQVLEVVSCRLHKEIVDALDAEAARMGASRTELIRWCLEDWLKAQRAVRGRK